MKKLLIALAGIALLASCAKEEPMSLKMIRSQMTRANGDPTYLDYANGHFRWNYTPGLELRSYLDAYEVYGKQEIYDFVKAWYDKAVNEDGTINTYSVSTYSTY